MSARGIAPVGREFPDHTETWVLALSKRNIYKERVPYKPKSGSHEVLSPTSSLETSMSLAICMKTSLSALAKFMAISPSDFLASSTNRPRFVGETFRGPLMKLNYP